MFAMWKENGPSLITSWLCVQVSGKQKMVKAFRGFQALIQELSVSDILEDTQHQIATRKSLKSFQTLNF